MSGSKTTNELEPVELDEQVEDVATDNQAESLEKLEPSWPNDAAANVAFLPGGMNDQFVGGTVTFGFTGPGVGTLRKDFDEAVEQRGRAKLLKVCQDFAKTDEAKKAKRMADEVIRFRRFILETEAAAENKRGLYGEAIAQADSGTAAKLRQEIADLDARIGQDKQLVAQIGGTAAEALRLARINLDVTIRKTVHAIRTEAGEWLNSLQEGFGDVIAGLVLDLLVSHRLMMFDESARWMQTGAMVADDRLLQAAGLAIEL